MAWAKIPYKLSYEARARALLGFLFVRGGGITKVPENLASPYRFDLSVPAPHR